MNMEEFIPTKSYPDVFAVSNGGNVKSLRTGKILKQHKNKKGYKTISTCIHNKSVCTRVHRLVAEVFCPNPDNKPQVHHIDNDKTNNHYLNLEWVTNQENIQFAYNDNLIHNVCGEDVKTSKLSEEDVKYIRKKYKKGCKTYGCRGLAKKYSVHHTAISKIINRKTWKHI